MNDELKERQLQETLRNWTPPGEPSGQSEEEDRAQRSRAFVEAKMAEWYREDTPSLQRWHWGKILMLWIGALLAMVALPFLAVVVLAALRFDINDAPALWITSAIASGAAPIIIMAVVTWKWLSGKDRS